MACGRDLGPACRDAAVAVDAPETPALRATLTGDLDAQLAALPFDEAVAVTLTGRCRTRGAYRWGQLATRNLGPRWTVGGDAVVSLEPDAEDGQPLYLLAGGRSVTGVTLVGNHAALRARWPSGVTLRTGGALLDDGGLARGLTLLDFGALGGAGVESFVVEVDGPSPGAIVGCRFAGFDPRASDTQVTVFRTMGRLALHEGNVTEASGYNWVQAHSVYNADRALVRDNASRGARLGLYGDWEPTRGVTAVGNSFAGCEHGVQLNLAPERATVSFEDFDVRANEIYSTGAQVSLNTWGPPTATRYIRDVNVHPSLSLEQFGAENVTRRECK